MRSLLLSLVILIATPMLRNAHAGESFGELTVQQVKDKLHAKNVYIYDNNDPEVFKDAHLPTAKWLNPMDYDAKSLPADKNATLIFYCHNEH